MRLSGQKFLVIFFNSVIVNAFKFGNDNISPSDNLGVRTLPNVKLSLFDGIVRLERVDAWAFLCETCVATTI